MNNISFDNPYLLFLLIPLVILIVVPFAIAIRKDNINRHNVISGVLHLIIAVLVVGVLSGAKYEATLTETDIYVLADVSYSTNESLDTIDEYINKLEKNLPSNSKMGVICFGEDYKINTKLGESFISVKNTSIDNSETNISGALEYTSGLFNDDVIKRIVLITDGAETNDSNIISLVDSLTKQNIYIDAIYLDSNISSTTNEVEIKQIDYTKQTFLNHEEEVEVLLETNNASSGILTLKKKALNALNEEIVEQKAVTLSKGLNVVHMNLDTTSSGEFEYNVEINSNLDTSSYNNEMNFVQKVNDKAKMLVLSEESSDKAYFDKLYAGKYDITYYINSYSVPFTMEELCVYDQFILSNIDVRNLKNYSQFVTNLETLVSKMGKSLLTFGNTYIQNNDDEALNVLSSMLPVKYGNDDQDKKLVTILIDISRSMELLSRLTIARQVACGIVDLLEDDDYCSIVGFAGEIKVIQQPIQVKDNRETLKEKINEAEPFQGTFMGQGLKVAYNSMKNIDVKSKEIMLISDGLPYGPEEDEAISNATIISRNNIAISTFQMVTRSSEGDATELMKKIASIGKGNYYYAESENVVDNIILTSLADDITDTYIDDGVDHSLKIDKTKDASISGVSELPSINQFFYNTKKTKANVVVSTDYETVEGNIYNVPIYSYWEYGNGLVSSYAGVIDEAFINDNNANSFLNNVMETTIPSEHLDVPFIFNYEEDGSYVDIKIEAPSVNVNASLSLTITYPNGESETKALSFDNEYYVTTIKLSENGNYSFLLNYDYGVMHYEANDIYTLSYKKEYDSFNIYDVSSLYYMVNDNGTISMDGNLQLENNKSNVITYRYSFTLLFSILAAALYIIDIVIRRLRWQDIKGLFFNKNKTYGGKKHEKN